MDNIDPRQLISHFTFLLDDDDDDDDDDDEGGDDHVSSKLGVIGCGWYPLIIVNTKSVTQLVMMILVVSLNTRVPLISIGVH